MSRDGRVFLSALMMNSQLMVNFEPEGFEDNKDAIIDAIERNRAGDALPQERFPRRMFYGYQDDTYNRKSEVIIPAGFYAVSARVAEILKQFDLGEGGFYPVELCQYNRKTLVPGDWVCWNFGARKEAFLPEESRNMRRPHQEQEVWVATNTMSDGDPAISQAALVGPDLWVDPKVRRSMFMSGATRDALKTAKLTRYFRWTECRMI